VRGAVGGDLCRDGGDVAGVDQPGAAVSGVGSEAAGFGDGWRQHEEVLHVDAKSAEALLVIFTTWSTPARAALSTTFSSWVRIARLTRITDETPRIAASMLAGTSRSP